MADDLRRKILLKQLNSVSGFIESSSIEDEQEDSLGDLPSEIKSRSEKEKIGNNESSASINSRIFWNEFFAKNEIMKLEQRNFTFNTYFNLPKVQEATEIVPVFIFHHGAGSSAMSFATLAQDLYAKMEGRCGTFAFDARGHGQTRPIDNEKAVAYDLTSFIEDFIAVIEVFYNQWLLPGTKVNFKFIFVGHSLGGSICTSSYDYLSQSWQSSLMGIAMFDIVEEAAITALDNVSQFLQRTPNVFSNFQEAIDWHIQHGLSRCRESAEIAIPSLFHVTKSQKIVRITNLNDFRPFWDTWFGGLSHKFVSLPCSKLLLLAGNDNLDKELIIGQMQGKYQLVVFQDSGHFIQEDSFLKASLTLQDFYRRNNMKSTTIKSNWGSQK